MMLSCEQSRPRACRVRTCRYLAARCLVELHEWDEAAAMLDFDMSDCLGADAVPPVSALLPARTRRQRLSAPAC